MFLRHKALRKQDKGLDSVGMAPHKASLGGEKQRAGDATTLGTSWYLPKRAVLGFMCRDIKLGLMFQGNISKAWVLLDPIK